MLFHGTSVEAVNKIVEAGWSPVEAGAGGGGGGRRTLFGQGVYLSSLPGVSLMYGEGLVLCKVLLGKTELYHPQGQTPPAIPENYDSREVIRDGLAVINVVSSVEQILPYCIINVKQQLLSQAGNLSASSSTTKTTSTTTKS